MFKISFSSRRAKTIGLIRICLPNELAEFFFHTQKPIPPINAAAPTSDPTTIHAISHVESESMDTDQSR